MVAHMSHSAGRRKQVTIAASSGILVSFLPGDDPASDVPVRSATTVAAPRPLDGFGLTSVVEEDSCQVELGKSNEMRGAGECCVITKPDLQANGSEWRATEAFTSARRSMKGIDRDSL